MNLFDDEERGCLWTLVEEVQLARDAGTRMGLPDELWDELDQLIPVVTMRGSSRWNEDGVVEPWASILAVVLVTLLFIVAPVLIHQWINGS